MVAEIILRLKGFMNVDSFYFVVLVYLVLKTTTNLFNQKTRIDVDFYLQNL